MVNSKKFDANAERLPGEVEVIAAKAKTEQAL